MQLLKPVDLSLVEPKKLPGQLTGLDAYMCNYSTTSSRLSIHMVINQNKVLALLHPFGGLYSYDYKLFTTSSVSLYNHSEAFGRFPVVEVGIAVPHSQPSGKQRHQTSIGHHGFLGYPL